MSKSGKLKISDKQRRLADFVLEGLSHAEAHERAGYQGKNENARKASASEILTNPNVVAYMEARRLEAAEDSEVTLKWLIDKAKDLLESATDDGAYGPAVSALKEISILSGKRVEKSTQTVKHESALDLIDDDPFDSRDTRPN